MVNSVVAAEAIGVLNSDWRIVRVKDQKLAVTRNVANGFDPNWNSEIPADTLPLMGDDALNRSSQRAAWLHDDSVPHSLAADC